MRLGITSIALPVRLCVVVPVADHRVTATPGTAHALRPAMLAHQREAFGVVKQPREVDQVACRHNRQGSLQDGTRQSAAAIITSEAPRDRSPAPQHPGSQQEPKFVRSRPSKALLSVELSTSPDGSMADNGGIRWYS